MIKKKMPSGAILEMQQADFDDGFALYQTVARELVGAGIIPKGAEVDATTGGVELEAITRLFSQDVNGVTDVLFKMIASKAIAADIRKCMSSCTYRPAELGEGGGARIVNVAETFGPEKAREDYMTASWEVMVLNLRPFWKNLLSMLSSLFAKPKAKDPAS